MRHTARAALMAGALALGGGVAPRDAAAALFWDFSYSGAGVSASGVLETSDTAVSGRYAVTGISGTRNGDPITALVAFKGFLNNDNTLSGSSPYVNAFGVSFVSGGTNYNLFFQTAGCSLNAVQVEASGNNCVNLKAIELVVTPQAQPAPEPFSAALLGMGLLGLAAVRRRS